MLKHEDITFEFGEAWVEERYEQRQVLIWYTEMRRAEWDYFCLEQKPANHQKNVSISLRPEFDPPFRSEGIGELNFFSECGDFWYQCVSTELKRVRVTVTATFHDKRETIMVGTAEFTRE